MMIGGLQQAVLLEPGIHVGWAVTMLHAARHVEHAQIARVAFNIVKALPECAGRQMICFHSHSKVMTAACG